MRSNNVWNERKQLSESVIEETQGGKINSSLLGERVYDITFWKRELSEETSFMAHEIENLRVHLVVCCVKKRRNKDCVK